MKLALDADVMMQPNRRRMRSYRKHLVFAGVIAGALFLQAHRFAPVEHVRTELPPDSVARAVETGNKELLDLSLKEGVDVNGRDQEGRTALMVATLQRNLPLIQRLLDGGASVDLGDNAGLTPLMVAAKQGDVELVRAFLAKSTTPDAP
jgi:ankyrin repeat protein